MTTYSTPISFTLMILVIALAIFKFDLMKLTPIALQRIVDSMSDGYMVIDEQNIISDFNTTLLNMFDLNPNYLRNKSLYNVIKDNKKSQRRCNNQNTMNKTFANRKTGKAKPK